jgi:nucleotide-binding universal stress UspA family protein
LALAGKHGAKLYAAHVTPEPIGLPTSVREGLQAVGLTQREDIEELRKLEAQLGDVPHETLLRKGDVWAELSKIIGEEEIDLVVIGTHGRTGVGKLLMGSVAEKIFRHTAGPVLTVGPAVSGEPESVADVHAILFPTDFRAESLMVLPYAISLAQTQKARLYLLHVARESEHTETVLEARLRDLIPSDAEFFCKPRVFVEFGHPAERILALTEELGVDLIVLGVKRSPLFFEPSEHFPQATAYKLVTQAICPVLTVRGRFVR